MWSSSPTSPTTRCVGSSSARDARRASAGRRPRTRAPVRAITTTAMRRAADLWADARRGERPTAPDHALDGDVILASQALGLHPGEVVVATTNPRHLRRYVDAVRWADLEP